MPDIAKPVCFVIMPIGAKDSETRKRSDKVLKHVFKKALADHYKVIRGDEIDEPGMITSQVLRAVQESPLVIADLSEHNPNVFYELAVRHAIEKPIIHVVEPRLSGVPFDIAGFRTIEFDSTDLDSIESAITSIQNQANQAASGNWGENPIKLSAILASNKSDSEELLLLKQAVEGIAKITSKLELLDNPAGSSGYGAGTFGTGLFEVDRTVEVSPVVAKSQQGTVGQRGGQTVAEALARASRPRWPRDKI